MDASEYLTHIVTDDIKRRMIIEAFDTCPELENVEAQDQIGQALGGTLALGILYGALLARDGLSPDDEAMVGAQVQFPELAQAIETLRSS